MEVTHTSDHISHVVIGGKETIDFGISSSAEFFNILSSTLYSDQKLAVVREVLCNAWDAHIEAGRTDRAVEVTLSSTKLTVTDYGNGIHHDDIGIVYGTYGNSTKKNDGKQTGGFGLGCKAPFAYTDHFEVTSSNGGTKTIYAMVKSSGQLNGKPGITPLAQIPCTESGLTAAINIKPEDMSRFKELIQRIAFNGDMNVMFNGKQVAGLNFDTSVSNWMIPSNLPLEAKEAILMVRYGNVIYPMDSLPQSLRSLGHDVVSKLEMLGKRMYHYTHQIVFQAPPNSLAVTPSRESLSMQEHTLATLESLMKQFLNEIDSSFNKESESILNAKIDEAISNNNVTQLLHRIPSIPGFIAAIDDKFPINTPAKFAAVALQHKYPREISFRFADIKLRVKKLMDAKLVDLGLAASYLKDLSKADSSDYVSDWQTKNVYGRMIKKILKANLPTNKLYVYDKNDMDMYARGDRDNLVPISASRTKGPLHALPYLQNIVVITQAKGSFYERMCNILGGPLKHYNNLNGFFVYFAGRKKEELQAAQQCFAATNMVVIDMTILEEKKAKKAAVVKPREKGLVCLDNMNYPSGGISLGRLTRSDAKRILQPEFIIECSDRITNSASSLPGFSSIATETICKLFATKGGVVKTQAQYITWLKKSKTIYAFLEEQILAYVKAHPEIKKVYSSSYVVVESYIDSLDDSYSTNALRTISKQPILRAAMGLTTLPTEEQKDYLNLLFDLRRGFTTPEGIALKDELDAMLPPIKAQNFLKKMVESTLLRSFDFYVLEQLLGVKRTKDKATKMFLFALNN